MCPWLFSSLLKFSGNICLIRFNSGDSSDLISILYTMFVHSPWLASAARKCNFDSQSRPTNEFLPSRAITSFTCLIVFFFQLARLQLFSFLSVFSFYLSTWMVVRLRCSMLRQHCPRSIQSCQCLLIGRWLDQWGWFSAYRHDLRISQFLLNCQFWAVYTFTWSVQLYRSSVISHFRLYTQINGFVWTLSYIACINSFYFQKNKLAPSWTRCCCFHWIFFAG